MEKLKLNLLQKWELGNRYSLVYSSCFLSDGRLAILTSEIKDWDNYCILLFSSSEIKEISIYNRSNDRKNHPVLFSCGEGFGIINEGRELAYYSGDFSSPELIPIKNSVPYSPDIIPQKAQSRYFQTISDSTFIPVCFENRIYYGSARHFALLEYDVKTKYAQWKSFSMIDKKAFTYHDETTDDMPKIDSLKLLNNEIYAFISGESTTSVNKWGMDYYALAKISEEGEVFEKIFESDNLKMLDKKGGINGVFTDSIYVVMTPLFKNDDWKGKQKLFSLTSGKYFDIGFPRGMAKHKVQNICGDLCFTFLYDRGLKEISLCKIGGEVS